MGLSYFWFVAAAIIGAMDLYFGNILLLVISGAAFITAILSFFLPSVYFQVAIFAVISLLVMIFIAALNRYRRTVDNYSESLRRHVGRSVTVHEWRAAIVSPLSNMTGDCGKLKSLLTTEIRLEQENTGYGKFFPIVWC